MTQRLLPCPFCASSARFGKTTTTEDAPDAGAEYIECEACGASTCLVFPCMDSAKQPLAERWNRRAATSPTPQAAHGITASTGEAEHG